MKIKKIDNYCVVYSFCIEVADLEKRVLMHYEKIKPNIEFKGFRKGHVPINIFKKFFKTDHFYSQLIENIVSEKYQEAVSDSSFEIVGRPELIDLKPYPLDFNKPLFFGLKFYLCPKVIELGSYKGLKLNEYKMQAEDKEIEQKIKTLLDQKPILEDKQNNLFLEKNDIAILDCEGFVDNKALTGSNMKNFHLEIGSGKFIKGFEESMIGMKKNEKKDIYVTFPDKYHVAELSNKKALFKVFLKDIKIKKTPIISDQFAKELNFKGVNNISELKDSIRKQIQLENQSKNKKYLKEQIIQKINLNSSVDISKDFLKDLTKTEISNFQNNSLPKNTNFENYVKSLGISVEEFEKNIENKLLNDIKWTLLSNQIIDKEKIVVSDDEVKTKMSQINTLEKQKLNHENYSFEQVKRYLLEEKMFDMIIQNSLISVIEKK